MVRYAWPLGVVLAVGLAVTATGQGGGKKEVKIEKVWTGRVLGKEKEGLQKLAPAKGYVSGPKAFAAIWKAWRTEEKVPAIDFSKKLVLVSVVGGPNMVRPNAFIDDRGNVTNQAESTLVDGPGFGYALGVVDRGGIQSVQGKAVANDE